MASRTAAKIVYPCQGHLEQKMASRPEARAAPRLMDLARMDKASDQLIELVMATEP